MTYNAWVVLSCFPTTLCETLNRLPPKLGSWLCETGLYHDANDTHTHAHTHTRAHTHTHTHTCMHACTHAHTHTHTHTHMYACMHPCTHSCLSHSVKTETECHWLRCPVPPLCLVSTLLLCVLFIFYPPQPPPPPIQPRHLLMWNWELHQPENWGLTSNVTLMKALDWADTSGNPVTSVPNFLLVKFKSWAHLTTQRFSDTCCLNLPC